MKETDIEFMRATLIAQQGSLAMLQAERVRERAELKKLIAQLDVLRRSGDKKYLFAIEVLERRVLKLQKLLFAPSSERRADEDESTSSTDQKKKKRSTRIDRSGLTTVERRHRLDPADCVCKLCSSALSEWVGQFDTSEEIHRIPEQFLRILHQMQKYRCPNGCSIETAPLPDKLHSRAQYSIDFAADVAADKYDLHLPLERQAKEMTRCGLRIDSQTLFDLLVSLCDATRGSLDALRAAVRREPVLGADETRWPVHGEPKKASAWHAWVLGGPNAVVYEIFDGRGLDAARKLVGSFEGTLIVDRYRIYQDLTKERPDIALAFCWSHIRRDFLDLEPSYPKDVGEALFWIRWIFRVESYAKSEGLGDEQRLRLRDRFSRVAVGEVRALLERAAAMHPPDSGIAKLRASLAQAWPSLERFLGDARIPPHNNASESRLRGLVVGRKNHYGSRSRRGTEVAAHLYSLVESAKLAGIVPREYLKVAVLAPRRGLPPPMPSDLVDTERRKVYEPLLDEIARSRQRDLADLADAIMSSYVGTEPAPATDES
jgi:transposase